MPVSVEVTLHGPGAAAALVERFRARVSDFRAVLRGRFHDEVRAFFARQWETEGA